jgi:hypothetical protein
MKIIVYGTFKSGTSTLEKRFLMLNDNYQVQKIHPCKLSDKINDLDILIVPIRSQKEIFMSAYFQDITKPQYDYYYGNQHEVIHANTECLLNKFYKQKWDTYHYLRTQSIFDDIESFSEIKIDYKFITKSDYERKYKIIDTVYKPTNKNIKILFVDLYATNTYENFNSIILDLGLDNSKVHNVFNMIGNKGTEKWYGDVYKKFKKELDYTKLNQYSYLDKYNLFG